MSTSGLSQRGDADLIFEVEPDPSTFDDVRRAVVVTLREDYGSALGHAVREHVRVDTVDLDPTYWRVEGTLDARNELSFDVEVPADDTANEDVMDYLRDRVDARFGDAIDPDHITFDKVSIRPNAWFVDAKIPAAGGG